MKSAVSFGAKCVGFLLLWAIFVLAAIPLGDTAAFLTGSRAWTRLCREAVPMLATGAVTLLIARFTAAGRETPGVSARPRSDSLLMGAGMGLLSACAVLGALKAAGALRFVRHQFQAEDLGIWIAALCCGAVTQALLCDGLLFTVLEQRFSARAAAPAAAGAYLLLHFPLWQYGPAAILNLIAMGAVLSMLRLRSRSALAPAAACFAWDFLTGFLLSCTPAGDYPFLTEISLDGPGLLSGGRAGVWGSLVTLAVLTACALLLAFWGRRDRAGREKMRRPS